MVCRSRHRLGRSVLLLDLADEAETFSSHGADQALVFAVVADGLADGVDMAGERRLGNDTTGPDRLKHVILADDALTVLHQMHQEIEDLRPYLRALGATSELPPVGIEHVIREPKAHVSPTPRPWRQRPLIRPGEALIP